MRIPRRKAIPATLPTHARIDGHHEVFQQALGGRRAVGRQVVDHGQQGDDAAGAG